MSHVTHEQAIAALCDPSVPPDKAIQLFQRAYRRSNEATRAFVLYFAGALRQYQHERSIGRVSNDG